MAQHTPGPWAVCDDYINVHAPETDIAITDTNSWCAPDHDIQEANAKLIAAAPELLAALERLLGCMSLRKGHPRFDEQHAAWMQAEAILAKAKGEE